ncbi:hypothetical protein RN607_10475 [Demequina capsici]|uniref:Uncharacterized protein n=1 Tax=Demequina capsici TaxID=3075620 RepID=A0AA96J8V4_9MICO|nr:hypothetical protein [Demequina sp. PMTSA13]WNM26622.1 hypothetical protein RN607_10475 [Demequina sp. PMTSA13]
MRLRTTALIAGLLGVIVLIIGLVANTQRPDTAVTVPATVDTAAVVVPADMLAFGGDGRYAVDGTGTVHAFSVLPSDLEAWSADKSITYVTGMPTWEELTTTLQEPAPSPSPSASGSASASAEPTSSPSPSASADAGPAYESLLTGSSDLWRDSWTGTDRVSVRASAVDPGLALVFVSDDGSPLTSVDLKMSRAVNDAWIAPLIVWGAILTAIGLVALAMLIIDVRPVQARAEEWIAHRQRIGTGDEGPKPGSRRARRMEGAAVPEAELTQEPDAVTDDATPAPQASAPAPDAAGQATSEPAAPEPYWSTPTPTTPDDSDFLPPAQDDGEEDR